MKTVEIFTDGACKNNPGKGGWAAILSYRGVKREIFGGEPETTNNRMELTAVIMALKALKEPCSVVLTTDSQYVVGAFSKGWLKSWQKNGWRNSKRQPVANADLWEQLLILTEVHNVAFQWVKGHNGHPENERCDYLATNECEKQ